MATFQTLPGFREFYPDDLARRNHVFRLWRQTAVNYGFAEYDAQVRAEYRWVPGWLYRRKRREVLAGFLARPAIYGTERFRERFEGRARENLIQATRR